MRGAFTGAYTASSNPWLWYYYIYIIYISIYLQGIYCLGRAGSGTRSGGAQHQGQLGRLQVKQFWSRNKWEICHSCIVCWQLASELITSCVCFRCKLCIPGSVLPDPFTIRDGWTGEDRMTLWPNLYFCDISEYLREKTPAHLYEKLCNEYKQGKAYRYV